MTVTRYRNPATRRLDLPFSMWPTKESALASVLRAALARDWEGTTLIRAVDERVVWTIHEDHIELYYRERPEGG